MSIHHKAVGSAGIRDWVNQNSAVVTVAAVAILIVALAVVIMQSAPGGGPTPPGSAYYYVPETQEVFAADAKLVPPIDRNGKAAVKAHFYGCGDCDDDNRFLGYYEKYSDAAKKQLDQLNQQLKGRQETDQELEDQQYELAMTQRFVSADGEKWILAESTEGAQVQDKLRERCGTGKLVYCSP